MILRPIASVLACFVTAGVSVAADLAPGDGYSIHLGGFDGVVYYTVEQDGYRIVATLASGAELQPIRFVSTLGPGQRLMISVPRDVGEPSFEFEVIRDGEALLVSEPVAVDEASTAGVHQ